MNHVKTENGTVYVGQRNRHWGSSRDDNEPEIISEFIAAGALVYRLAPVSKSEKVPDLLVGFAGIWALVEVKQYGKTLSPGQAKIAVQCQGHDLPWFLCDHIDDTVTILAALNKRALDHQAQALGAL